MSDIEHLGARFLGYVQLHVGSKVFALPVQAVALKRADGTTVPGGFVNEGAGQYGILVDIDASPGDVKVQIEKASEAALRHISKQFLN